MKKVYNKAAIFLNGNLPDAKIVARLIDSQTYIIGCDGGTDHLRNLQYAPNVILGDLDSISKESTELFKQTPIISFDSDKDYTDSELSIDYAMRLGIKDIIIVNILGDRIDHLLGNLFLLIKRKYSRINLRIIDGNQEIYVIRKTAIIQGNIGDTISLMPLRNSAIIEKSSGLQYDLSKYKISQAQNHGISNVMTSSTAKVVIKNGLLLVVHQTKLIR